MALTNKELARWVFEVAWNGGNLERLNAVFDPRFVGHDPVTGERSRAGYQRTIQMFRSAFPDLHVVLEESLAEGDKVVVRWVASGTHQGGLLGIGATRRPVELSGITILRFQAGKVIEEWSSWNAHGLMQQLGAAPSLREQIERHPVEL